MSEESEQKGQQTGPTQYQAPQPQAILNQSSWNDFINFRRLWMFSIIKYVYILGAIGITLFGFKTMFTRASYFGFGGFWAGLAVLLLGNLVWRLVSETTIVLFRIAEGISSIDAKMR